MRKVKNKKIHMVCNILVIIAFVLAILIFGFYRQLNKHMKEICEYKGRETANEIIIEAINKELKGNTYSFVNIIRDGNNIASIETNSFSVNEVQNHLIKSINNSFSNVEDKKMHLPIGTLSGINLLSGRGPEVTIQLHQVGAVDVEMRSEFESVGINQTKHRIYLRIKIELSAILPTSSTDIEVDNDYLVSETIIVGNIPNAYLGSKNL